MGQSQFKVIPAYLVFGTVGACQLGKASRRSTIGCNHAAKGGSPTGGQPAITGIFQLFQALGQADIIGT